MTKLCCDCEGNAGLIEVLGNIIFGEYIMIYASLFGLSLFLCGLIYRFGSKTIGLLGRRDDVRAVQSAHMQIVPRIGGVAFFISIIALLPLTGVLQIERSHILMLLASLLPILIIGLAEDLGWPTTPKMRLLTVAFAGFMIVGMFGVYLPRFGIPILDPLLTFVPVAVVLTVFMAAGVVNGFNIVDGLNGLCGFITISTAVSLAVIADRTGQHDIFLFLTLIIPPLVGFLAFNFPFGLIFLGDAGAYMIGHTLVWIGIAIVAMSTDVSPFAILLVFFWPVADTMLAIYRRRSVGRRSDQPDRLHFHQLMMRYLEIRYLGRKGRRLANPFAALCLIPMIVAPQILGVVFAFDNKMAASSVLVAAVVFVLSYMIGVRSAREVSRRRPFDDPVNQVTFLAE